jgi:RNA polymerase sigma-70 factor (ECF subfamily)
VSAIHNAEHLHLSNAVDSSTPDPPTDAHLLRAARRDPDAFCKFYDRHAARLHGWLLQETGNVEAATDLTAETFAQALRSLRRFRGDRPESGRAWLYAIARHLLARYRQTARLETSARQRLGMPYQHDETGEANDRADGDAARRQLSAAVSELSVAQQRALGLRVVKELPYTDVAKQLGCSPAAARIRVSRALQALNKRLEGGAP